MRVYSGLVISNPTASQLFFLAREEDKAGQGWVVLSIRELRGLFDRSRKTILRWARNELYFSNWEVQGDKLYLKYRGIKCIKEQLDGCFHSSFIADTEVIRDRVKLKEAAYEAALHRQQDSCEHQVMRKVKSSKQVFTPTREGMRSSSDASGCDHISPGEGGSCLGNAFIKRHIIAIGASQTTVAQKLGRSRQTVIRYSRNLERARIWQRINLRSEHPDYYYEFTHTKVTKTGKTRRERRLYRRMPNYYFFEGEVRREETIEVNVISDPCILIDQKNETVKHIIAQMPSRRVSTLRGDLMDKKVQERYVERLRNLTMDKLSQVLSGFYLFATDRVPDPEIFRQVDRNTLVDKFQMMLGQLDEYVARFLMLMLQRVEKGKAALPPMWQDYRPADYKWGS